MPNIISFDQLVPAEVTDAQKAAYRRAISNWTYLSGYLSIQRPDLPVLGILIRLELNGANRRDIVERLTSRMVSRIRDILLHEAVDAHERIRDRALSSRRSNKA